MFLCISKSLHSIYFVEIERLFLLICWKQKKENWVPQKLSWYSMSWVFISQKLKFLERTTSLHMYLVQAGDSIASGLLVDPFKYICKTVVLFSSGFLLFFFAFLAFFVIEVYMDWSSRRMCEDIKQQAERSWKCSTMASILLVFPHQSVFWAFFLEIYFHLRSLLPSIPHNNQYPLHFFLDKCKINALPGPLIQFFYFVSIQNIKLNISSSRTYFREMHWTYFAVSWHVKHLNFFGRKRSDF